MTGGMLVSYFCAWAGAAAHTRPSAARMIIFMSSLLGGGHAQRISVGRRVNVRFGSEADICSAKRHVRFTPNSDIDCVFRHVRFGPKADINMRRVQPAP